MNFVAVELCKNDKVYRIGEAIAFEEKDGGIMKKSISIGVIVSYEDKEMAVKSNKC